MSLLLRPTKMSEKQHSQTHNKAIFTIVVAALIGLHFLTAPLSVPLSLLSQSPECSLPDYVRPLSYLKENSTLEHIIHDPTFRQNLAAKLSGAVKVPTDVSDDPPPVEEAPDYWRAKFEPFHAYLQRTFPLLWLFCTVEKVNEWGLVITWHGADNSKKPLILTAHQDVVPIQEATLDQWLYPPFDGFYDGESLWGRGSADCKNLLIGLLETAEELHKANFRPKRTVVFAFGFDEESSGIHGARHIGKFLLERYGENGAYAIVDEGGQSLVEEKGVAMALIGTAEKGFLNFVVGLNTPGGHSSVPPDHTSIGIMSDLITRLEKHKFEPLFTPRNPTFYEYQCIAEYSDEILADLALAIRKSRHNPKMSQSVAHYIFNTDLTNRYLVTTSQAVDIMSGGVKLNALPEYTEALVNHRIAVESSSGEVLARNVELVKAVASDYDLGVVWKNKEVMPKTSKGHFVIKDTLALEPAPLTPLFDEKWDLFAGNLRHVYEEVCAGTLGKFEGKTIVPAPGMATGNTDTQHYWGLTRHIYRYRPGLSSSVEAHAHGVDEHIPFDSHLHIIAFYYEYIQLVDAAESD